VLWDNSGVILVGTSAEWLWYSDGRVWYRHVIDRDGIVMLWYGIVVVWYRVVVVTDRERGCDP